jgi:tRNA (guanosine-2'-O-)-methyltransferase
MLTPERETRLKEALARRQPDLTVLLERVNKPHNFAAILRTCDAVGILEAHWIPPERGLDVKSRAFLESSASAAKWVFVREHRDPEQAVKELKQKGFWIYAAHFSSRAQEFRKVDYTRPSCVVLGAELWGVSERVAELADEHIVIPMLGLVQSLNVSVAAAVILFEAQRQRMEVGAYDRPRLGAEELEVYLARWRQA